MTPAFSSRPLLRVALIFCAMLAFETGVLMSMSETFDESAQIDYGARILQRRPERFQRADDGAVVMMSLNALPRTLADALEARNVAPGLTAALRDIRSARVPTALAGLLLAWFIHRWAVDLYGASAGTAALILTALSPNIIAHATLATADLYFTLGVVASLYYFRRFLLTPTRTMAALSALSLAVAQLAKPFAIYLYAVVALFLARRAFTRLRRRGPDETPGRLDIAMYAALAALAFVIVLNIGYGFVRSFTPVDAYAFESEAFVRAKTMPIVKSLPVPVPYAFLQGLDLMKHHEQTGQSTGNLYLLGELRLVLDPAVEGFPAYYAVAWFFKEPIALQLLFVLGLVTVWRRRTAAAFLDAEGMLLVAAAVLFVWLSLFNRAQIGIRQILPCLGIELIIASAPFADFTALSRPRRIALVALVAWLAVSVATYYPHMIPYMNEWMGDRKMAYRVIADSNLDWGQNTALVEEFKRQNPAVIEEPTTPTAGRILASANVLVGVLPRVDPNRLRWLRSYTPIAHVGYAHLLFDISPADLERDQDH